MDLYLELDDRRARILIMITALKRESSEDIALELLETALDNHVEGGYLTEIKEFLPGREA